MLQDPPVDSMEVFVMADLQNACEVVFLTSTHSISGQLDLGDRRLSDWLNTSPELMIRLRDVRIAHLCDLKRTAARCPTTLVRRSSVVAAFEAARPSGPSGRRLYSYVQKHRHAVCIVVDGMDVSGHVHTLGSLDLGALVGPNAERFLPVTEARVTLTATDRYLIEQKALLVSVEHIKAISAVPEEAGGKAN
jgi:hypothetical protein